MQQIQEREEKRQALIEVISVWEADYNNMRATLLTMSENDEGWSALLNSMLRAKENVRAFTAMLNKLDDPGWKTLGLE